MEIIMVFIAAALIGLLLIGKEIRSDNSTVKQFFFTAALLSFLPTMLIFADELLSSKNASVMLDFRLAGRSSSLLFCWVLCFLLDGREKLPVELLKFSRWVILFFIFDLSAAVCSRSGLLSFLFLLPFCFLLSAFFAAALHAYYFRKNKPIENYLFDALPFRWVDFKLWQGIAAGGVILYWFW
jgi:hypothetical protein